MSDFECLRCEHHKNRAARWRAEAYKQAGHDKIELPWVGLTADEIWKCNKTKSGSVKFHICYEHQNVLDFAEAIEAKLREKNHG